MTQEKLEHPDRRVNDRRHSKRRSDGGWRLNPEGRRGAERRSEGRRA